jgi:sortase A
MYPEGTVYQNSYIKTHGETKLRPPFVIRLIYRFLRLLGVALVVSAVVGIVFTLGPALKEEFMYRIRSPEPVRVSSGLAKYLEIAEAERIERVKQEAGALGVNSSFSIVIPKIEAKSEIIANVDASDEDSYLESLKKGVAHARGTYFPGQNETVYLFAHSTNSPANFSRYNAVFYLLRKLEPGDQIVVFFADEKYEYRVTEKLITTAEDTTWFKESSGSERLVLQTCDPPGTTWRRLIVVANPI